MSPKISVITINYNNKNGLEKTLESVISQDYTEYEYIVIDGGSNDGSKEAIEFYAHKITYWVSETDQGIYNAMNKGIAASKGEYLIFINSGDEFYNPQSLTIFSKYIDNTDIIYSNLEFVNQEKKTIQEYPAKVNLAFFMQSSLPHPATLIRKSAFELVGVYDENLKIVSDWKWFLLAIVKYQLSYKYINEIISTFYLDGISSQSANYEKIKGEREITFKKHFFLSGEDIEDVISLKQEVHRLKSFENRFNYLKKFRLVRLLDKIGLIKIPE